MTEPVTMTIRPKAADLTALRRKIEKLREAKDRVSQYRKILSQWEQYKKGLEQEIAAAMQGSGVGLVEGRQAVTYEPKDQFAHAQFIKDHSEVAELFMVTTVTRELDWRALLDREPELAEPYRTKIMKVLD
jgi:hypothetical protein